MFEPPRKLWKILMLRSHPSPIKLALRSRKGTRALVYFSSPPWNTSQKISGTQSGAPPNLRQVHLTWGPCYNAACDAVGLGWSPGSAFLISSRVMPMLLIRRLCFVSQGCGSSSLYLSSKTLRQFILNSSTLSSKMGWAIPTLEVRVKCSNMHTLLYIK